MKISKKYKPLWSKFGEYDYAIINGGRASGKSWATSLFATELTFERNRTILYARYTQSSQSASAIPEVEDKISLLNAVDSFKINRNEIENKLTNSKIIFKGIKAGSGNQTANLKSLFNLSVILFEEAEEIPDFDTFQKIDNSVRDKKHQNAILLIFNQGYKTSWIWQHFFLKRGINEGFNGIKDRILYISTSYLDNIDNLSDKFIAAANWMKKTDIKQYEHIYLNKWLDRPEGVVFNNWEIGEFDTTLPFVYGLDFGFNHPDSMTKVAVDESKKIIYIKEMMYESKQSTDALIERVKKLSTDIKEQTVGNLSRTIENNHSVICDSAEPRIINDMRAAGIKTKSVKKPSVLESIKQMQGYKLVITKDSINLRNELENYVWSSKDEVPIKLHDDLLDSVRYTLTILISNNYGKYNII